MKSSALRIRLALVCALACGACQSEHTSPSPSASTSASTATAPLPEGVHLRFGSSTGSSLAFVGAKMTESHEGRFDRFDGEIVVVGEAIESSRMNVRVDLSSVSIAPERLRTHLLTPDLFDVAQFPEATFHSTSITRAIADGQTHLVKGELTLHGVTKEIEFPAAIALSPSGVRATADFVINRQNFGITYPGMPDNLIRDDVRIRFDVRATR